MLEMLDKKIKELFCNIRLYLAQKEKGEAAFRKDPSKYQGYENKALAEHLSYVEADGRDPLTREVKACRHWSFPPEVSDGQQLDAPEEFQGLGLTLRSPFLGRPAPHYSNVPTNIYQRYIEFREIVAKGASLDSPIVAEVNYKDETFTVRTFFENFWPAALPALEKAEADYLESQKNLPRSGVSRVTPTLDPKLLISVCMLGITNVASKMIEGPADASVAYSLWPLAVLAAFPVAFQGTKKGIRFVEKAAVKATERGMGFFRSLLESAPCDSQRLALSPMKLS